MWLDATTLSYMAQAARYELLYETYFPFRLYADFKRGATVQSLASEYLMPVPWIEERIEAARVCIEKQVAIEVGGLESA